MSLVCEDDNVCTDDRCDAVAGCVFTPNSAGCDDGSVCTGGDHCSGGSCVGSMSLVCEDDNVCTTDRCDAVLGCVLANNTLPCDDGEPCTTPDACAGGICVGTPTGLTNCGGECVDTRTDHDHCGDCTIACAFDEDCVASVCVVRPWEAVGAVVNPALPALAHALGTDGRDATVAWVADEAPQDNVYVHRYVAATGWTALGARLNVGGVQPVVDIQFNVAVPNVLYDEQGMALTSVHVKAFDGAAWNEVGAPGARPPCMGWMSGTLALNAATPHHSSMGAGGCGIGVAYQYWDGTAWWQTPQPPAPMPGLITMNGGGCTDVVWDSAGRRALVALIDAGNRYVRTWVPLPAPGAWTNLGGSLNMHPPGPGSFGGDYLWMALDSSGAPWVAFSELDGTTRGIFVKRLDPAGTGWTLVGTTRLSDPANSADYPSLAFAGGTAYVAYVEQVGGVGLVRVRRWTGTAWERVGTALNVSTLATAAMPYLVAVGSVPYVAFREPATGTQRIYVKRFP
jgi:hypothetical protein